MKRDAIHYDLDRQRAIRAHNSPLGGKGSCDCFGSGGPPPLLMPTDAEPIPPSAKLDFMARCPLEVSGIEPWEWRTIVPLCEAEPAPEESMGGNTYEPARRLVAAFDDAAAAPLCLCPG
mmetsp:Transcript_73386/g.174855  ORF Transcript_73386/g.174855 Transcript_73386/m.174855 type:complete len:119 (-) Transcript_73386:1917-2273(-)